MTRLSGIVATSEHVSATSSRLAKAAELAACLRRLDGDEIEVGVAFLCGEVRQGRLGIGWAQIQRARPGNAAQAPTLTLADVDRQLAAIATTAGRGSAAERGRLLAELFARATQPEQEFLVRLLIGELRQGALEGLMLEAIAKAAELPLADVRRAAMLAGGLAPVARAALLEGRPGLAHFAIALFHPVLPMLAQPADGVADALQRLGNAALEWKLDGARVQVHKSGEDVRVFTRSLKDVTPAVPEVVEVVRALPARESILDGEALALAPDGSPHPFQVTMRRFGRKLDVAGMRQTLPLSVLFFDCLRLDDEDLIDTPTRRRLEALSGALPSELGVPRLLTSDRAAAEAFLADAIRRGHEGIMAKSLAAPYEAGSRGSSWLKVKQAHTLDLVVLAAEWGHGRRRGWLSNLHLGARDSSSGGFVMLGKTFKGMTDEVLAWQTRELLAREIGRDAMTVYVRPELVVEVAFNEIQASPQYPAGLALRFARIKRYRPDKQASEADTIDAVRALYAGQQGMERAG